MPFADPTLQEKQKPRDQLAELNLAEGLALLDHIGKNIKPKAAEPTPLTVDKAAMTLINKALDKVAGDKYKTVFDKCTSEQKVEVLKLTLETGGAFGLKYDRRMDQKPQTAMEFLASKSGNCADFSRLLVAVAKEKGLPVQMVSITFQAVDETREEEQHLAVFNIGDKIYYIDLSNQVLRPYSGFTSSVDLVKDQKFRDDVLGDYGKAVKDGRDYVVPEDPRIMSGERIYQATYWVDVGHYYFQKKDWKSAVNTYEKARDLGLDTYWVNSELGRSYYEDKKYDLAVTFLQKAIDLRSNASVLDYLTRAHLGVGREHQKAGDYAGAEKEARLIITDPAMSSILFAVPLSKHLLGMSFHESALRKPNAEDGIQLLQDAIRLETEAVTALNPKHPDFNGLKKDLAGAYHDLIGTYANLGKIEDALALLTIALREADQKGLPKEGLLDLQKQLGK